MMKPLAQTRKRLHFVYMARIVLIFVFSCVWSFFALAQETPNADPDTNTGSNTGPLPAPIPEPAPEAPITQEPLPEAPEAKLPDIKLPDTPLTDEAKKAKKKAKDLTIRSEADRTEKLEKLFRELYQTVNEEDAELVAEEIWAVFLQSRSASVDFLLLRGIAAEKRGDLKLARRMFDHVLELAPKYAEGWSRSARLSFNQRDYNRAMNEITHALSIEPRHFYALWTLGNILEILERPDAAFEAYIEAEKIYPLHKQIKERVEKLKENVKGKAL